MVEEGGRENLTVIWFRLPWCQAMDSQSEIEQVSKHRKSN